MQFTVLTPTYNRSYLLHRVYESLRSQTFADFEWLVVDDGSTDDTRQLVEKWMSDADTEFSIRYIWQKHSHKKTAINNGVRNAKGELLLILDSDDRCAHDALEIFLYYWHLIPKNSRNEYVGVCALCADTDGRLIGDKYPGDEFVDASSLDIKYRFKVQGEKWGFMRVDVLRKFPFPEDIPGYVPEHVIWDEIGRYYETRFINKVLRIYYRDNPGLIARNNEVVDPSLNALGTAYGKWFVLTRNLSYVRYAPFDFYLEAARLLRYWYNTPKQKRKYISFWPNTALGKIMVICAVPAGALLWLIDRMRWLHYKFKNKKEHLI